MKKTLQKAVFITAGIFCALNLSAQSVLKVGDEFDTNIDVSQKNYQALSKKVLENKSTSSKERTVIYEKEFYSKSSSYVKLYFENFDLAPKDYLEIIGGNTGESIIYAEKGKIIDNKGNVISDFWSRVMLDDKVTVKLHSYGNIGNHKGFEIKKVAYGYSEEKIQKQLEASKSQKAICSSDNKESIACYQGTEMFEKSKAVCRLLIGGSSLCTGWLLGSEGNLMTNNHCIGNASSAQNTDFMFNYQYANCAETTNATSDIVASSATFIKTSSSLDYTLVKLPVNPTATYGYLSLSSVIPSAGDRIYIPQHPGGRRKEISVNTDSGGTPDGFSSVFDTSLSNAQEVRYLADTEGGSSGSPVLAYDSNLVIAIHNTGGCPNGSYGRCDSLISSIGSDMPANGVDDPNGDGGGDDPDPTGCSSTISGFPYSESFESGTGWSQASGDDGDWVNDASGTPSSTTGPSAGADGSFYMFLEASTNGSTGQIGANATAILESPCFDLSGESQATFAFQNHMYGTSVGSLTLQVSTNEGSSWSSIWSLSGNQGNQWNEESVSLNSYVGQSSVQLRFVGTTGSSWSSDIAIDDLALTTSGGSDTSAPSAPSNVSASNVTQTAATISWSASSDNIGVTGYDVYQGSSLLGQTTNTSVTISSLVAGTTYTFNIVAVDAAGNQSSAGSVTFTTTSSGGGNLTYCDSEGSDSSFEWIDYVSFGGFTNSTGDDGGYADYTNFSASVAPGSTNTLVISAGFASSSYTEYWKIWIDYDQNGTFDDDEVIASGSSSSSANLSVAVTIPTSASLGTTTMRVSMKYNAEQTACETFTYGEVEDYTVNISTNENEVESLAINAEALGNESMTSAVIYPNPAKSFIEVSLSNRNNGLASYRLVNTIGQTIMKGKLESQNINVSSLKTGIYILEVNDGQKTFKTKLIKE